MIFGRKGTPDTQWTLPWDYTAGTCDSHRHSRAPPSQDLLTMSHSKPVGSICTATVNVSDVAQKETMSWVDIWAGAVAADASESAFSSCSLAIKQ